MKNYLLGIAVITCIAYTAMHPGLILILALSGYGIYCLTRYRTEADKIEETNSMCCEILKERTANSFLINDWIQEKNFLSWEWASSTTVDEIILNTSKEEMKGKLYFRYDHDFPRVSLFRSEVRNISGRKINNISKAILIKTYKVALQEKDTQKYLNHVASICLKEGSADIEVTKLLKIDEKTVSSRETLALAEVLADEFANVIVKNKRIINVSLSEPA